MIPGVCVFGNYSFDVRIGSESKSGCSTSNIESYWIRSLATVIVVFREPEFEALDLLNYMCAVLGTFNIGDYF